jgi:Uncharacterised protein family UPF0047
MDLLLSTSEHISVMDGCLALDTWRCVFLVELDGPRVRRVRVHCAGYHAQEPAVGAISLRAHNGRNVHTGGERHSASK